MLMHALGYTGLQQATHNYMKLHSFTPGCMRIHKAIIIHRTTIGYTWLLCDQICERGLPHTHIQFANFDNSSASAEKKLVT